MEGKPMAYTADELKEIFAGYNEWVKERTMAGRQDDGKRGVNVEIYIAVPKRKRGGLPTFYVKVVAGLAEIVDLIEAEPPEPVEPPKMAAVEAPPEKTVEPPKVVKPPEPVEPPKAMEPPRKPPSGPTTPKVIDFKRLVTWDICRDVVTMFEKGMSQNKIRNTINISSDTVYFIINGYINRKERYIGPFLCQLPMPKEFNYEDFLCVKVARGQGASYWDIVTTLGVTAGACDWYLHLDPEQEASLKMGTIPQSLTTGKKRGRPRKNQAPAAPVSAERAESPEPVVEPLPEPIIETTPEPIIEAPIEPPADAEPAPEKPPGLLARLWRLITRG
jgi:hypothetical protein